MFKFNIFKKLLLSVQRSAYIETLIFYRNTFTEDFTDRV